MKFHRYLLLIFVLAASACKQSYPSIETFQLMGTSWDDLLYTEFQRESSFNHGVSFKFNIATSAQEEAEQIEQAIERGVSAIVVNPYSIKEIKPVVEKAYDSGIHVILVGQKLPTFKYTSYVGINNKQVGVLAAEYVKKCLPEGGNIIEIEGYRDVPFYLDRSEAFRHVIDSYPEIRTVARFDAAWSPEKAHAGLDSLKTVLGDTEIDLVFGYGDEMVLGAVESMNYRDAKYVGSDGIPGNGLQLVLSGALDAAIYTPTGGAAAISTAINIIRGRSFVKDYILEPVLVTTDNAKLMEVSINTLTERNNRIDVLIHDLEREQIKSSNNIILTIIALILLAVSSLLFLYIRKTRKAVDNLMRDDRSMKEQCKALMVQKEVLEELTLQMKAEREILLEAAATREVLEQSGDAIADAVFMKRFREAVEKHIDNAGLSVDDIAAELGVSRAQLFRKVKAEADATPNELIQSMRLKKSDIMLKTTDLTISEISYAVGFTSPSYFSKCYKDMFGTAPSDKRSRH